MVVGFLQVGLRNRIGKPGGTGSSGMCWMVPRTVSECFPIAIGDLLWAQEISYGHKRSPMAIRDLLWP